ncbi:MAG: hypothetical protein ACLPZF_22360 [Candidatus Acidiferrales bacterium]
MPIQDQQEGRLGRGVIALERFTGGDMHGINYAVSISIASAILWIFVLAWGDSSRIGKLA